MITPHKECDYCKEQISHGGKCYGFSARKSYSTPCLRFEQDPRGKICFEEDSKLTLKISDPIPKISKWSDDYTLECWDTPLKYTEVTPIRWITDGMIAIECKVKFFYYDNTEFDDQGEKKLAEVIPMFKDRSEPPKEEK